MNAPTPTIREVLKNRDIKELWVAHGGSQHGPRVEHYTIPEVAFWEFINSLRSRLSAPFLESIPADGGTGKALEWCDRAERSEWAFMAKMLREAIDYIAPVNLSGLGVAEGIAKSRSKEGWRKKATGAGPVGEAVAWPDAKVTNPDIANPTGVPYLDCLLHRLLDAQQDVNEASNETMSQSLADVAALMDEVERTIRLFAARPVEEPGGVERLRRKVDDLEASLHDEETRVRHYSELAAETQERLEKAAAPFVAVLDSMENAAVDFHRETQPEAAAGLDDADLAALVHPDDSGCFTDGSMHNAKRVTVGDIRALRAALTGDAQEAKAPAGDA